jgi:hypothetical protein
VSVHVVGVRHHSPACAGLVRDVIQRVRPEVVLIEGPADMNARLGELMLDHRLPIAVFSYYHGKQRYHASWTPFCSYSPEWVALREGHALGADVRFMDLPAWAEEFEGVQNRYADPERRYERVIQRLCRELRVDGMDALWDDLFEQPIALEALAERLSTYFDGLRGEVNASDRDRAREDFMSRCLAWAARHGDVVAVCGGMHKPALERLYLDADGASFPQHPEPGTDAKHGSFLVPYSFRRLDSFVGYESGMPSPAFYQAVWDDGPARASEHMFREAVERLRKKKQVVSAADLIAARTLARALARLRGRTEVSRCDLLDGLASALLKEAQDAPLPWSGRGVLRSGTHPILVEIVAALSGSRQGVLAPDTPRPPLLAEVRGELERHELVPTPVTRKLKLTLSEPDDREKSRVLNRLRVLEIPGFTREQGPVWATDPVLDEHWALVSVFEAESALIEASAYGGTLELAALGRLEQALIEADDDLARLAALLGEATFIGIDGLSTRVLERVASQAQREPELGRLGAALTILLSLYRHDNLLGAKHSAALGGVLEAIFDRGLWLVDGVKGANAPADDGQLEAILGLRDTLRFAARRQKLPEARARSVMRRCSLDSAAPPSIRGAALGFLWSLGELGADEDAEQHAISAMAASALPTTLGDFLAGLFALAREQVLSHRGDSVPPLVVALNETLRAMTPEDFLIALPSLRMAHAYFPPREREQLAGALLSLHGEQPGRARSLIRATVDPELVAAGMELERRVERIEARYGLSVSEAPTDD